MVKELDAPEPPRSNSNRTPPSTAKPATESTKKTAMSASSKAPRETSKAIQKAPSESAEETMQRDREELAKGRYINFAKIVILVSHFFGLDKDFLFELDMYMCFEGSGASPQCTNRKRIMLLCSVPEHLYCCDSSPTRFRRRV
jgi:hypothetical protein